MNRRTLLGTLGRAAAVLFVAYPLLAVSDESCGGAEQMLCSIEAEMARRGVRTMVAASAGSRVAGALVPTGDPSSRLDDFPRREAEHLQAIREYLASSSQTPDLIHDHSGHFWRGAGSLDVPVLATLHLPRSLYPPDHFRDIPRNVWFNFVSEAQRREFGPLPRVMGVVRNGISVHRFVARYEKEDYLLWMGRICQEKGTHVAIEVARRCGMPLVIAGDVYPFSWHQDYFRREVLPHLTERHAGATYLGPQNFWQKLRLLRRARALLVTSLCSETSSVAAMEGMACGTPVLGFRRGAIPEVVADGRTGFVVDDAEQMAAAVARLGEIDLRQCRERVVTHFNVPRVADEYEGVYAQVLAAWDKRAPQEWAAGLTMTPQSSLEPAA